MPTLDELREARERIDKWWKAAGDYFPDPEDPDKRFSWRIKAKYYAGALDAYSDYVKLLEADRTAQQQRISALEAENSWVKRALKGFNADSQERFDAYWNEVFRVLEVNKVSSDAVYDAKHNASIILASVMRKQAETLHADAGEKDE